MQIIKDKQITEDNWRYIEDDAPLCTGDICVSLKRWQTDREQLLKRDGRLGLRLQPDQPVEAIAEDLQYFQLIELNFPVFTDGRSFSQAWLLRNRYRFRSEIRAVGHFMRDQMFYLQRVGVNAFQLEDGQGLESALTFLNDFSVTYQPSTC